MKNKKIKIFILLLIIILTCLFLIFGCSSSKQLEPKTPESVFNEAVVKYNDGDYIEAATLFDVIKLQYSASQYSDDAQYYLAEINYKRKEYILGAFNYNYIRTHYPYSEYVKIALFKAALCYYELSPSYERDPEYTAKAIQTFQEFQYYYPKDSLFNKASEYISILRNKLAESEFKKAELYRTIRSPRSSIIYYDVVINDFTDTKFYEPAYFGKIEALIETKKIEEAKSLIILYDRIFPNGIYKDKINIIKSSIPN